MRRAKNSKNKKASKQSHNFVGKHAAPGCTHAITS